MRTRLAVASLAASAVAAVAISFASPAPRAEAAPEGWALDKMHSFVYFRIPHMTVGAIYGRFDEVSGMVQYDPQNLSASSVEVTVETGSVDTGVAGRDQHIKNPDFFDAAQFPEITFKSTAVKGTGDQVEVSGNLTLHGVTKPVTVPMKRGGPITMQGKQRIGFEGTLEIHLKDFNVGKPDQDLPVKVMLSLEATK